MAISQSLQQRQSQSLVMTPQLAQSIKLLQYSHTELMEFVHDEVEKNPLLELSRQDPEGYASDKRNQGQDRGEHSSDSHSGVENTAEMISGSDMRTTDQLDANMDNVFDGGTTPGLESSGGQKGSAALNGPTDRGAHNRDDDFDLIANAGEEVRLIDHLEKQIALTFRTLKERDVAMYIAHGLTGDGYFTEPAEEAALRNRVETAHFDRILAKFQTLEPSGIGARNLAECLTIQLQDIDRFDPAMETLIDNLDLLARREFSKLMKLCAVDRDDFALMIEDIQALDPRPARAFEPVLAETVVPDVIVSSTAIGDWRIELNPDTLPKVLVDREYHLELTSVLKDAEGEKFVGECLQNANWLVRALDQRAQTILKVTREIVKQQDRFFTEGQAFLKPLTLKTVAEAIKMHESTVSRVTSNKYLSCDSGTFELKYFFSSSVSATEGEQEISAEAVKYQIKKLIDNETADKILSDDQIAENLLEAGIEIARRTVAKYREAMHIASSVQRRREKRNSF